MRVPYDFRLLSFATAHSRSHTLTCVRFWLLVYVESTYLSLITLRHVINIHKSGGLVFVLLWCSNGWDLLALGRFKNKGWLVKGVLSSVTHEGLIVHRIHRLVHWLGFVQRELKLAVKLLVIAYGSFMHHLDTVYHFFLLANFNRNFLFFPCHFIQVLLDLEKSCL